MTDPVTYAEDLHAWAFEQAGYLRSQAPSGGVLDWWHLAEEIESLGNEQEHAVESQLRRLLLHLLKWRYQPPGRRSWRVSILNARFEINKRLRRNPGLREQVPAYIRDVYPEAVRLASVQTGLSVSDFPPDCEWSDARILDPDFFPDA